MHKRVQALLNDKFRVKDRVGDSRIWYNAYDVALTQFAFIGLAILYPEKCGLIAAEKEDLENINYYWRVLGYMMGLPDEFNFCQFDKFDDIQEFTKLIFENEFLAKFEKESCETGLKMTQGICLALHYFTPLITFNNLAHWWQDKFYFNGYRPQPMNLKQSLIHTWSRFSFNHLVANRAVLGYLTRMMKARFEKRLKKRDKVYEELKKEYKDQTEWTFYSDRVDYFASKSTENDTATVSVEKCNALNGHQQVTANGSAEVTCQREQDDNNNNSAQETVFSKPANGCPFGFSTGSPVAVREVAA